MDKPHSIFGGRIFSAGGLCRLGQPDRRGAGKRTFLFKSSDCDRFIPGLDDHLFFVRRLRTVDDLHTVRPVEVPEGLVSCLVIDTQACRHFFVMHGSLLIGQGKLRHGIHPVRDTM